MKTTLFILTLLSALLGCSSGDSQGIGDITQFDWRLVSIELENEIITIPERDYLRSSAYILSFLEDSTFDLDTSANVAKGKYTINGNLLELRDYQELTEVGTILPELIRIDGLLTQQLVKITAFNTDDDNLTLSSMKNAFVFKKIINPKL